MHMPLFGPSLVQVPDADLEGQAGGDRVNRAPPSARLLHKLQKKTSLLARLQVSSAGGRGTPRLGAVAKKHSSAKRAKQQQQSKALGDLGALSVSLEEAAASHGGPVAGAGGARQQFGKSVGTLRARSAIANAERERLQAVLAHPQFIADPIAAISKHLEATMPPPPLPSGSARGAVMSEAEAKQRRRDKKKRQALKREERKADGHGQMLVV
jgi:hypothetical protein